MAKPPTRLKHLAIEKVVSRVLGIGPKRWRWRTKSIANGQIGVWSETYNDERDCDASIRTHQFYLRDAEVVVVDVSV